MSKTILITGASRGIGRAAAIMAGQRGWSVGVNYASNEAAAQEAVQAVSQAGGKAIAIRGDVSRETDVIAMFDANPQQGSNFRIERRFPKLFRVHLSKSFVTLYPNLSILVSFS